MQFFYKFLVLLRNFKRSNFNAERRRKIYEDLKSLALVKLAIAVVLFLVNPFLGIWLGTSGLMIGGLAGSARLIPAFSGKTNKCYRDTGLHVKVFHNTHIRNHARAYRRSSSRPAFTGGSDDAGGGSESDSSDPSGHSFSFLLPFIIFPKTKKINNYHNSAFYATLVVAVCLVINAAKEVAA